MTSSTSSIALVCALGGGGLELFEGFLCSVERYRSVTEAEQLQVAQWLEARAEVTKVEVSELIDANYAF